MTKAGITMLVRPSKTQVGFTATGIAGTKVVVAPECLTKASKCTVEGPGVDSLGSDHELLRMGSLETSP
jgi:hypothetical protein